MSPVGRCGVESVSSGAADIASPAPERRAVTFDLTHTNPLSFECPEHSRRRVRRIYFRLQLQADLWGAGAALGQSRAARQRQQQRRPARALGHATCSTGGPLVFPPSRVPSRREEKNCLRGKPGHLMRSRLHPSQSKSQ